MSHFTALAREAEQGFLDSQEAPSTAVGAGALQYHNALVGQIRRYATSCTDLTAAMVSHTQAHNITRIVLASPDTGAPDDAVADSMRQSDEINELRGSNDEMRSTIAQLRTKNAEVRTENIFFFCVCVCVYINTNDFPLVDWTTSILSLSLSL